MIPQTDLHEIASERLSNFILDGEPILCRRFGKGHINDTYLVVDDTARLYILQKINSNVFRDPLTVMRNIVAVTSHLTPAGGSPRGILELVRTRENKLWLVDGDGEYWRVYSFITDCVCFQQAGSPDLFRESGVAFGTFQKNLLDFPAHTLGDTIPGFHNTPNRYKAFHDAVDADIRDRVKEARAEIDFALEREPRAGILMELHAEGSLPLRVTHNDTKLDNVLFDRRTRKSLCIIDLDTVMPGFSVTDFGDSIRFGASTGDEDERDLSKVEFSLPLFEAYAEGFLSACGEFLSDCELDNLCTGAFIITLENGVRFLTDFLSGDTYYKTRYADHNLVRCRTQFKLVEGMEAAWDKMQAVIKNLTRK